MGKIIGWVLLIGNLIWFCIISFIEPYELLLYQAIGNAAGLIAGAILISGSKK